MRRIGVFLAVVSMLLLAMPVVAQEEGPPANLRIGYHVVVQQGHGAQFEEGLQAHRDWHAAQNDTWRWDVWQLVVGERLGRYVTISGGHRWADFDNYPVDEAADAYNWAQTAGPHVASEDSWMDGMSIRGSRPPENPPGEGAIAEVIDHTIKPGKGQDFWNAVHRFTEAANQSNWPVRYVFLTAEAGGQGNVATLVVFHSNWAGMGEGEPSPSAREMLVAAIGEEEADKLFEAFGDSHESTTTTIWRYRADLSYIPGQ